MAKHALVEQPSPKPTAKVTAAGLGAALAMILLTLGDVAEVVELPTFWDTFITGVAAFVAGYMKKAQAPSEVAG